MPATASTETFQLVQLKTRKPLRFEYVDTKRIETSPTNTRSDWGDINDLAESVGLVGIIQPLVVRPAAKAGGTLPLIAGERRLKAAKMAGLKQVPVVYYDGTAVGGAVVQLVENVKRVALHPMDEAQQLEYLSSAHNMTAAQLSEVFGVDEARVVQRLKLRVLIKEARKAFLADTLTEHSAFLIARIPDEGAQREALKLLLDNGGYLQRDPERAISTLRDRFMCDLANAPFRTDSETLIPKVGACLVCPYNTEAQRLLFADLGKRAAYCTNTPCYKDKAAAAYKAAVVVAKEAAQPVVPTKEAREVLATEFDGTVKVAYGKDYVLVDAVCDAIPDNKKSWRNVLKDQTPQAHLIQDPAGGPRQVYKRTEAVSALRKAGLLRKAEEMVQRDPYRKQMAAEKEARKRVALVGETAIDQVRARCEVAHTGTDYLRIVAGLMMASSSSGTEATKAAKARGEDIVLESMSEAQLRALVAELALRDSVANWSNGHGNAFLAACKAWGVDVPAIESAVKAATKPTTKGKAKA